MTYTVQKLVSNEIFTLISFDIICTLLENDSVIYNDYYENLNYDCDVCEGTGEIWEVDIDGEEGEMCCDECDGEGVINHEPLEFWLVTPWLGRRLKSNGGFVFKLSNLTIWGREASGQAIKLDYIMEQIAKGN